MCVGVYSGRLIAYVNRQMVSERSCSFWGGDRTEANSMSVPCFDARLKPVSYKVRAQILPLTPGTQSIAAQRGPRTFIRTRTWQAAINTPRPLKVLHKHSASPKASCKYCDDCRYKWHQVTSTIWASCGALLSVALRGITRKTVSISVSHDINTACLILCRSPCATKTNRQQHLDSTGPAVWFYTRMLQQ